MFKAAGLEYEIQGEGEPLLLIHGGFVYDSDLPLMSQLALRRYKIIRYHRRGFGGSEPHTSAYSVAETAADALSLLRALGIERAHVSGHSSGGVIAVQLAVQTPEVVHSLVLREPAMNVIRPAAEQSRNVGYPASERYLAGDVVGAVDTFFQSIGPSWRTDISKMIPDAVDQAERSAPTMFEVETPAVFAWQFDADIAKSISQPVLSLIGTAPRIGPGPGTIRKVLHEWLPQTEDFDVPGANHLLQYQSPEVAKSVAEGMAAFLAKHPLA